jgi:hypothetical protein
LIEDRWWVVGRLQPERIIKCAKSLTTLYYSSLSGEIWIKDAEKLAEA